MAFSHCVMDGVWIVESVEDDPDGRLAPFTERTVWETTRTRRTVSVDLVAYHKLQSAAASDYSAQDPDVVPNEHVDEIRGAVHTFYAGDDIDVDYGEFALAHDVDLQFEEFWQGVGTVQYSGDVRDVEETPVTPGVEYTFKTLTMGSLLKLVGPDGDAIYIDGTDAVLEADNWEVDA